MGFIREKSAIKTATLHTVLFVSVLAIVSCDFINTKNPFGHPSGKADYSDARVQFSGTIDGTSVSVDTNAATVFFEKNEHFADGEVELLMVGNNDHQIGFGPHEKLEGGVTYTVKADNISLGDKDIYSYVRSVIYEDRYGYQGKSAHDSGGTLTIEEKTYSTLKASFSVPTSGFDLSGSFMVESYSYW